MIVQYDLSQLSLISGKHKIQVRAKAPGYVSSGLSNSVIYRAGYPEKGDLISMNIDGTTQQYRVLTASNNIVEVVGMTDLTSTKFSNSSNVYNGSNLDNFLESTWFYSLDPAIQSAMIEKTIQQECWEYGHNGDPQYHCYAGEYEYYIGKIRAEESITRHVYILNINDVCEYAIENGVVQGYRLQELFWNDRISRPDEKIWLMSYQNVSNKPFCIDGSDGKISPENNNSSHIVRPVFKIDLSMIEWNFV